MTREELVKELNKIKDITVEYYNDNTAMPCIEIYYNKGLTMSYYDNKVLSVIGAYFKNRTPEQVLSVVKALVE